MRNRKMRRTKAAGVILAAMLAVSNITPVIVTAQTVTTQTSESKKNQITVYYNMETGSDTADGKTEKTAVKTLEKAKELAGKNGKIVPLGKAATATPAPTATPEATPTPEVTVTPAPEATPEPTPEVTVTPAPEATPEPTPEVTVTPAPEATPEPTPEVTVTPAPEATPEPTPEVTVTPAPEATPTPEATVTPEATPAPEGTDASGTVTTPEGTNPGDTTTTPTPEVNSDSDAINSGAANPGTPSAAAGNKQDSPAASTNSSVDGNAKGDELGDDAVTLYSLRGMFSMIQEDGIDDTATAAAAPNTADKANTAKNVKETKTASADTENQNNAVVESAAKAASDAEPVKASKISATQTAAVTTTTNARMVGNELVGNNDKIYGISSGATASNNTSGSGSSTGSGSGSSTGSNSSSSSGSSTGSNSGNTGSTQTPLRASSVTGGAVETGDLTQTLPLSIATVMALLATLGMGSMRMERRRDRISDVIAQEWEEFHRRCRED